MKPLTFHPLSTTHKEHQPEKDESGALVLKNAERQPIFIKKGTSRLVATGIKLQVPAGSLCTVAQRRNHGNGFVLLNLQAYTSSRALGADGKPAGEFGEGVTGEISVLVSAPYDQDLPVRAGEEIAVAFCSAMPKEPKETQK